MRAEVGAADRGGPVSGASRPGSGFADVRNHLTSEKLKAQMGTDVFAWHGYSELLLDDRWYKLSTAFNIELCERFGVKTLDFDGTGDALMHPFDKAGNRHMEYVNQRGSFDDLPLDADPRRLRQIYGDDDRSADGPDSAAAAGDDAFAVREPRAGQRGRRRCGPAARCGPARARGRRARPGRRRRRRPTSGRRAHITSLGAFVAGQAGSRCSLPSRNASSQPRSGGSPRCSTSSSSRTATAQSASAASSSPADERGRADPSGARLGDLGGQLQDGRRRVGALVADGADLLDGHAVDGADLLGQQVDRRRLGQRHDELVDDPTAAALEDVDRRDVAVDGADAAGHLAERTRPIRQPDPHDQRAGVIGRRATRPRSSPATVAEAAARRHVSAV